jgi:uncharacterized damage-inducible protein DinB
MKRVLIPGFVMTFISVLTIGASAQGSKPSEQKEKPAVAQAKTEEKKAAEQPKPRPVPTTPAQVYNNQLSSLEKEMVDAAEAMPPDKFNFAPDPKNGEFNGVRTFKEQIGHVAANNFLFASWLTGEKVNISDNDREKGPASLTDKDATVKYLKDSFAAAHKALDTLNSNNLMQTVDIEGGQKRPRLSIANIFLWHGFDHYGQMALYLRMNGIVPPASRPRQ